MYWLVRLQLARLLLCRHDVLRSAAGQGPTSHLDFGPLPRLRLLRLRVHNLLTLLLHLLEASVL